LVNVTVFVGARPYLLTELEARRLAELLREAKLEVALRLAWALELIVNEDLDEPLDLGWPQADAVIRAMPEVEAHAYSGLEVLLHAARRLAAAPP
jgi:hypothetical protein